jgi:hypothetical protein
MVSFNETFQWGLGEWGRRESRHRTRVSKPLLERLEERVAMATDLVMVSATTRDSRSVDVSYRVDGDGGAPVDVAIYRSADANFDASDIRLAAQTITDPTGTATGARTMTVAVSAGLTIDPSHPYVLAVADAGGQVAETNEANNVASFRKYVIGGISHGTDPAPLWEGTLTASLRAGGYDRVVPFFWIAQSFAPVPGLAVAAGQRMAAQIIAAAHTLPAGSVIDLHLIGHSRGSVVISQAMKTIQRVAQSGADAQLRGVLAGWTTMTYLDPHPAHNVHTTAPRNARFYSASPGPFGQLGAQLLTRFQNAMRDPEAFVPNTVDRAEVFFQHAPYYAASDPLDRLINIWGETPIRGATHYFDLTGISNGHYVLPYWYQKNVVPTILTGGTFTPPSATPLPSRPSAGAQAFEARVLFPTVVDRTSVLSGLLGRASLAASAFRSGNTAQGLRRYNDLLRYAIQQRSHIQPPMLAALRLLQPGVARLR